MGLILGLISSLSWTAFSILALFFAVASPTACLVAYRLYFHPLAKFPGSPLARSTFLFEFYYTYFKKGAYYLKIEEMHRKHGPVIRITPDELHVDDPLFFERLFVHHGVRRTENYPPATDGTGFEDMTAVSNTHEMHRSARLPLNSYFSKGKIRQMEQHVLERVHKLCARFRTIQGTGKVVNITNALNSVTTDAVSSILFVEPSDYLGDPNFNEAHFSNLKLGILSVPIFAILPWLAKVLITRPILKYAIEKATNWTVWDDKARREIEKAKRRPSDEAKGRDDTTFFNHMVDSRAKEAQYGPGGFCRLAQLIQQAGTHNVSLTLSTILTYLLLDETKLVKLRAELGDCFVESHNNTPSWLELEKLPYLKAVIQEGLRIAMGAMNRSARVCPDEDLRYGQWFLPKGFPVSMSSFWMHRDPTAFPEPDKFIPERWQCGEEQLKVMNRYFVPFSRGSRGCLAENFVWMLNYLLLAHLLRPGDLEMELYNTDESDVVPAHGYLFVMPKLSSKGVRATIH